MNETPFYKTRMGQTFYDRTAPELVKQLERLNEHLGMMTATSELVVATTHLIGAAERVLEVEIVPGSPATRSAFADLRTCVHAAREAIGASKEK